MLATGALTGLWLVGLAFLLGQAARGALAQSAVTERIDEVRVGDIMDHEPIAIPSLTPLAPALDEYFLRYGGAVAAGHRRVGGRFVGIARRERVTGDRRRRRGLADDRLGARVRRRLDAARRRGRAADRLPGLASRSAASGALIAVDGDGILRGVVTLDQVRRALASCAARAAG